MMKNQMYLQTTKPKLLRDNNRYLVLMRCFMVWIKLLQMVNYED